MGYRADIRAAVRAMLLGNTPAADRVFVRLDRPLNPATDLPAIVIYTTMAKRSGESNGNALIPRVVTVSIEAALQASPEAAIDLAEAMAETIEDLIEADPSLGNLVRNCTWRQSISDTSGQGAQTLGVALVEYDVEFDTQRLPDDAFTGDDGFTTPPTVVISDPIPRGPGFPDQLTSDSLCGPDGCDIPAWGGERQ